MIWPVKLGHDYTRIWDERQKCVVLRDVNNLAAAFSAGFFLSGNTSRVAHALYQSVHVTMMHAPPPFMHSTATWRRRRSRGPTTTIPRGRPQGIALGRWEGRGGNIDGGSSRNYGIGGAGGSDRGRVRRGRWWGWRWGWGWRARKFESRPGSIAGSSWGVWWHRAAWGQVRYVHLIAYNSIV